jgi:hypothetical protein
MNQTWKPVVGYEDHYEVSDSGRVRSLRKRREMTRLKVTAKNRYPRVEFCVDKKRVKKKIHLLVLEAFVGPRNGKMESRHLNGDVNDARLENLCYGTSVENKADQERHGRRAKGSRNGISKLTELDVVEIRSLYPQKSQSFLAERFGVSIATIHFVVTRRNWAHV